MTKSPKEKGYCIQIQRLIWNPGSKKNEEDTLQEFWGSFAGRKKKHLSKRG